MSNSRIFDYKRGVVSTTDAGTATIDIPIPNNTVIGLEAKFVLKRASNNDGGIIICGNYASNNGGALTIGAQISIGSSLVSALSTASVAPSGISTNFRYTVTGVAATGVVDWEYEIKAIIN